MNLAKLFGSKCRAKILERFCIEQATSEEPPAFFIRELSRELDEQLNSVRRELLNLEELGILRSEESDRKKVYRLAVDSPLYSPISDMCRAAYDPLARLREYIAWERDIDLATWGRYLASLDHAARQNGVVDIFLIGTVDRSALNHALSRIFFGQRIRYAVMEKSEFLERLQYSDRLVIAILTQKNFECHIDRIGLAEILAKIDAGE